jgi:hypothetical protein
LPKKSFLMFFNSSKGVLIEFLPPNIKERGGMILPFPGLIVDYLTVKYFSGTSISVEPM